MFLEKKVEPLSAEEIINKLGEYSIYRYYIGEFIIGGSMVNPVIGKQETGSFGVYMKNGRLYHADFAVSDCHGDCVAIVQQMYQLNYRQALDKICNDFQLRTSEQEYKRITGAYNKPIMDEKRYSLIQCSVRKFTAADERYWAQYGISPEECKANDIYSVKDWFLNRKKQVMPKDELCYGYLFNSSNWKVYRPYAADKAEKWRSNVSMTTIENADAIEKSDKILITKSRKCRILLSRILPNWTVCNIQNEGPAPFTDTFIESLKGKEVVINFDNDQPGKKESHKITSKFKFRHLNVPDPLYPTCKDFSDMYKEVGIEPIIEYMKNKKML